MEFVLVGPPVDEDEVLPAAVVDAQEADPVPRFCDGRLGESLARCGEGGVDELGSRPVSAVGDSVDLETPSGDLFDAESADRPRRVRLGEADRHTVAMGWEWERVGGN